MYIVNFQNSAGSICQIEPLLTYLRSGCTIRQMKTSERRLAGASLAVLVPDRTRGLSIATIQRDDRPDIPFPGRWELPGGGIEKRDYLRPGKLGAAVRCARREAFEEIHVLVPEEAVIWQAFYPSVVDPTVYNAFVVAEGNADSVATMDLGSEGRQCQLMSIEEFLHHDNAIVPHQMRVADFLRGSSEQAFAYASLAQHIAA